MSVITAVLGFSSLMAILSLIVLLQKEQRRRRIFETSYWEAYRDLAKTRSTLRATQIAANDIVLAAAPLVEKTDWMTGRWGGQFQTLVRMESKRNQSVEKVRKAMFDIPHVQSLGVAIFTAPTNKDFT